MGGVGQERASRCPPASPTMHCCPWFIFLYIILTCLHISSSFNLPLQRRVKKRQFKPHYRLHCTIDPSTNRSIDGTVQRLCNLHDYAYVGPVSVGEPGQVLWMDFDTGSADSWLMTSQCRTRTCLAFPRFQSSLSSTFKTSNERLKFVYGMGDSMQGYRANDKICMGSLCVDEMDLAAATIVNQGNVFMDGLIGLAYSNLSIFGSSFIDRIKHHLREPLFAVWLNRDTDLSAEGGEITFGYTNPQRYTGRMEYVPVVNQSYWTVQVDSVYSRDHGTGTIERMTGPSRGIIDTATSFIIGPNNTTTRLIEKWYSEKLIYKDQRDKWSVDCGTLNKLPHLIFVMGRRKFVLTPEDYTLAEDSDRPCDRKLAIDGHVHNVEFWVLGGSFIGRFYTVFDFGKHRIGFAPAVKSNDANLNVPNSPGGLFTGET